VVGKPILKVARSRREPSKAAGDTRQSRSLSIEKKLLKLRVSSNCRVASSPLRGKFGMHLDSQQD
jgi:hypothetical protein